MTRVDSGHAKGHVLHARPGLFLPQCGSLRSGVSNGAEPPVNHSRGGTCRRPTSLAVSILPEGRIGPELLNFAGASKFLVSPACAGDTGDRLSCPAFLHLFWVSASHHMETPWDPSGSGEAGVSPRHGGRGSGLALGSLPGWLRCTGPHLVQVSCGDALSPLQPLPAHSQPLSTLASVREEGLEPIYTPLGWGWGQLVLRAVHSNQLPHPIPHLALSATLATDPTLMMQFLLRAQVGSRPVAPTIYVLDPKGVWEAEAGGAP